MVHRLSPYVTKVSQANAPEETAGAKTDKRQMHSFHYLRYASHQPLPSLRRSASDQPLFTVLLLYCKKVMKSCGVKVHMRVAGGSTEVYCMCTESSTKRCALLVPKSESSGNGIMETACTFEAQVAI